ncbi:MAG TPA: tRNA uridine-5-carboxymethylaminomethyl(34) synthesis GTPase MnmE, partial [Hyphomicrobiaceae bacterium]|nr:tRNA uridine-5-carboxymethylaminomethyl(34) synthesis GTPase MnmE [Hyphomicrobiaceae bacterium]
MSRTDTIYALSSSPGKAAIAVVRISGPGSLAIAASLMGSVPAFRRAALRTLRDHKTNTPIDQAMVLLFEGPASATGEDLVEFHLHGSRAVLDNLFGILALFPNTRLAEPGEFSRRAFENGKLDLTAAEGIADLIDAETEAQRRQALRQTNGALARLYDGWRRRLIEAQALIEAAIDFSDEGDVSGDAIRLGLNVAEQLRTEIATHLAGAARGEITRSGYRVVIAGPPNAGKSSLLNALARRDVAIVSHEAGTTRDVIEVHLDLDGLAVIVSDTAGVREAKSDVEREGIRRAMDRAETADLVIWLDSFDDQFAPPAELTSGTGRVIHCTNKADLGSASSKSHTTAFTRDDQH